MPENISILNETVDKVATVVATAVATVVPPVAETTPPPTPTIPAPPAMTHFADNIGAAVGIVVNSLSKALAAILLNGGFLLVLLVAGLGFMFVAWAIRLIHLRGR